MASSSPSTLQAVQDHLAEQEQLEHQEQQAKVRCVCQENFSHEAHQKSPELFSPVAQSMVNIGFGYIALIYALAFGLSGLWAAIASFRANAISAQSNALANTANQLALLQACLSNSVCCLQTRKKKPLIFFSLSLSLIAANMLWLQDIWWEPLRVGSEPFKNPSSEWGGPAMVSPKGIFGCGSTQRRLAHLHDINCLIQSLLLPLSGGGVLLLSFSLETFEKKDAGAESRVINGFK